MKEKYFGASAVSQASWCLRSSSRLRSWTAHGRAFFGPALLALALSCAAFEAAAADAAAGPAARPPGLAPLPKVSSPRLYVIDCGTLVYNRPEDYQLTREQ